MTATPISTWTVVPWETLRAGDPLGVLAFHHLGIECVEFRFGRRRTTVFEPGLNPRTGVREYFVELPRGTCSAAAVITGRDLSVSVMTMDINPPHDDVLVLRGETVRGPIDPRGKRHLWLDECELDGGGHWHTNTFESINATECIGHGTGRLFLACNLVRGCTCRHFASDAFRDCRVIINCDCRDQIADGPDHSDCVQYLLPAENAIVFNLRAEDRIFEQGIFSRGRGVHHNVAIVDCRMHLSGYPAHNQWQTRTHHMVVEGCSFTGAPVTFKTADRIATGFGGSTDVVIRRNVFQWVQLMDNRWQAVDERTLLPGIRFEDNSFINRWPADSGARAGREVGRLIGTRARLLTGGLAHAA